MVPGTQRRPGGQLLRGRERLHVHTDLRYQVAGRHVIHPGHGLPERDGFFKRGDPLVDLCLDALDSFAESFPLVQVFGQQETVVIAYPSCQRLLQLRDLPLQLSSRQLCQLLGIVLAADDRFQHVPPGYPQRVRSHRTQFEIGLLQKLLDPVVHPILALAQLRAVARQVP